MHASHIDVRPPKRERKMNFSCRKNMFQKNNESLVDLNALCFSRTVYMFRAKYERDFRIIFWFAGFTHARGHDDESHRHDGS